MPKVSNMLQVENITVELGDNLVLKQVGFSMPKGSWLGIIGPNGAGKTTLLRCIARTLPPKTGSIVVNYKDLYRQLAPAQSARIMAVVPQQTVLSFDFSVRDFVLMGRLPHLGRFARESPKDLAIAERVMWLTGTHELADRSFRQLSGGQQQLAAIARALAQEPKLLLLDEPTNHLDINHQVQIMDVVKQLNHTEDLTVVSVLHDLNLAALYCDFVILLEGGTVQAHGSVEDVFKPDLLKRVYQCSLVMSHHPITGKPQVHLVPGECCSLNQDSYSTEKVGR